MTDPITPEKFDVDAWLSGATKPTRSAKVFQRGDLLAEIDELAARIELAEKAEELAPGETALSDSPNRLRAKYADLVEEFNESALTVRLKAHTKDEQKLITKKHKDPTDAGFALVSEAITPVMSVEQLKKLHSLVGEFQFGAILKAYNEACQGVVEPSADFLPRPSTTAADGS
ncbi:hypothetical protein [Arthrobacter sp. JSM 101049]|uniref:hypothetical protein n=1 Tax=Arthrobacter sp. JSM 101049 TaxID=929097 RepID=UPI00356964BD